LLSLFKSFSFADSFGTDCKINLFIGSIQGKNLGPILLLNFYKSRSVGYVFN